MYRSLIAALKKAIAFLITIGFFAAAVFLAAVLRLPAEAAPARPALYVQSSLFLALDVPERPAPKPHLRDLPALTDEEWEMIAALPPPDLVTELNNWTYTQSGAAYDLSQLIQNQQLADYYAQLVPKPPNFPFDPAYQYYIQRAGQAAYYKANANLYTAYLLRDLGFGSPLLSLLIDNLQMEVNRLSPYK